MACGDAQITIDTHVDYESPAVDVYGLWVFGSNVWTPSPWTPSRSGVLHTYIGMSLSYIIISLQITCAVIYRHCGEAETALANQLPEPLELAP
jgi:hypothetical protein